MAELDNIKKIVGLPVQGGPKQEPQKPKNEPPKDLPTGEARQFSEVHETASASGERLNQSALVMAQTAITLAKLGRLGNVALTKLLDIEELVSFSESGDDFVNVARAWVAKVVNPDLSHIKDDVKKKKWEDEMKAAGKDETKVEQVKHAIGQEMIQEVAKKIQDFITAEDARVKEWVETSRPAMVQALGDVRGALVNK